MTMRVLYVDDDRINTVLFEETCRCAGGVEVETAGSGAEALELVRRWTPQLLVIDLHLPDTMGYALLAELRAQIGNAALPAYLCTADDAGLVSASARDAGFDGCWAKPVELQHLRAELARREGGAAASAASPG